MTIFGTKLANIRFVISSMSMWPEGGGHRSMFTPLNTPLILKLIKAIRWKLPNDVARVNLYWNIK